MRIAENIKKISIKIPQEIICGATKDGCGNHDILTYSFLATNKNLFYTVDFTLDHLVRWCGYKPDSHVGKSNHMFSDAFGRLVEKGYVYFDGDMPLHKLSKSMISVDLDYDKFFPTNNFAIVYLDELLRVIDFKSHIQEGEVGRMTTALLLTVFAYLRLRIRLRSPDPMDGSTEQENRRRYPETYNAFYKDIACDISYSARNISRAVKVLGMLGLVYHEELCRSNVGNRWYTGQTLFSNTYRRRRNKHGVIEEVSGGEGYYLQEIKNKKKILGQLVGRGDKN